LGGWHGRLVANEPPGIFLTAAIWILGVGLQFAAPLLRDRVPLSDDLLVGSFVNPLWLFGQVLLLAGVLTLVRKAADGWATGRRARFAIAMAILCSVPQPDLITQLLGRDVPLAANPLRVALLWSTPLAFYVIPPRLSCTPGSPGAEASRCRVRSAPGSW
jgi:hypothetical protein